ncbi:myoneurin isoform X2 [Folsomia candida]|uniref:myoneurin isoform X2 n=1 Tax=Folsomia candida TaxID=158441 RepID=UPI001604E475|nr:myoneurin isoform X2 [Folsomia candida]
MSPKTGENCSQGSDPSVFYQCDKCDSFFESKPLVVIHLSKTSHEKQGDKPNSTGWRTVPFPTPILKLDRVPEVTEVKDDPPQFAPPLFVPVKMAKYKFKTFPTLADPLGDIDSGNLGETMDDESSPPSSPDVLPEYSGLCPTCEKCKLSFSSTNALQRHQFLIINCADRAAELAKLRRRRHGPPKLKPRRCQVCGIMCRSQAHYDQHTKAHSFRNSGASTCDACGVAFYNTFSLERHQINGSKPKVGKECRKCGRTFTQSWSLKRHLENGSCFKISTRGGVAKKKCDTCGLSFTQSGSLKRHLENDSCFKGSTRGPGSAKKKCETCGLSFTQIGSLKRHLENDSCFKGPSRAVRIACDKCGLAFAQSRSLKFHLEKECCTSPGDESDVEAVHGQNLNDYASRNLTLRDGSQEDDVTPVVIKDEDILIATDWSELVGLTGDDEQVIEIYEGKNKHE